ncbi:MAG: LOG family protein [Oricola sp.]
MTSEDTPAARAPEGRVPSPAHPQRRREALPQHQPKSHLDDPGAPARVAAIKASASYRPAIEDVGFLEEGPARGPRLELDYLKAETLLDKHGIEHSIVVFGSTRIAEPAMARRQLAEAAAALARDPDNGVLKQRVAVAERVVAKSRYYQVARDFGRLIGSEAAAGGNRLVVVTGGGPGIMEAANRGAWDAGAPSVGLNITLPHEQFPNPYITPELCFQFHYFAMRKLHFMMRARALVVFPGGYGTMDELFETLTLIQTRKIAPVPVVLVGEDYWRQAFDPDFLIAEGTIAPEDRDLFWFAETAEEIWSDIRHWYKLAGRPLTP